MCQCFLLVDGVESNNVTDLLLVWGNVVRQTYEGENHAEQVKAAADGNAATTYMLTELNSLKSDMRSLLGENKLLKSLMISQVSSIFFFVQLNSFNNYILFD